MAKLVVSSLISSLTTIDGIVWRQEDYDASKMKKFVKGDEVRGYFDATVGGKSTRFENKDRDKFCGILARTLAQKILTVKASGYSIVPVSNSIAVSSYDGEYETLKLANAVAGKLGSTSLVCDALRWQISAKSSRKGGSRDPQVLNANLEIINNPEGQVILLDDVMTTGAHMIACARKFQEQNVDVLRGIVAVRATWEQREKIVSWVDEEIEVNSIPGDHFF